MRTYRLAIVAWAAAAGAALAGPITPGNLVVYRVGDGSAALGTTATAVFLDEYTTAGSLVQSIPLATSGGAALTAVGNATTEGIISPSQDGTMLVFTGYRRDVGLSNPGSATPATVNRVIGTITLAGTPDTSIGLTDPTGTIRSATTVDGSNYYISASGNFLRYVGTPGPAATSVQIDGRNSRQVNLYNNVLWASNGSTAITAKVQSYGVLPTTATAATPQINLTTADAVNGFIGLDLDPGVAGIDTIYLNSQVESRLRKYTFDGTNWIASGFISSSSGNVTAQVVGNTVNVYITTNGALQTIADTSGYGGTLAGTLTTLATAGTNTAFRGISFLLPEPTTLTLLIAGSLVLARRRR